MNDNAYREACIKRVAEYRNRNLSDKTEVSDEQLEHDRLMARHDKRFLWFVKILLIVYVVATVVITALGMLGYIPIEDAQKIIRGY